MRFTNPLRSGALICCAAFAATLDPAPLSAAPAASKSATHLGFTVAETADGQIHMQTVAADSPAGRRGLKKGDRILVVDQTVVRTVASVQQVIAAKKTGDTVRLTLSRDQYVGTVTLRMDAATTGDAAAVSPSGKDMMLLGMGLSPDKAGRPIVADVSAGSPAADAGIQQGDIIQEINGVKPATFQQFGDTARKSLSDQSREMLALTLSRGGKSYNAVIKLTPDAVPVAQREQAAPRRWGARTRTQAAVAHLDRLSGSARTKQYIGNIRFISQLEETTASTRIGGLAPGYYVIAAHSHGDLSKIDVTPFPALEPGDETTDADDTDGPNLRGSTTLKSGSTPGPLKPRKTRAELMIEDVPPVTPASAARANAGVEPASETEAATIAQRNAAAELARRRAAFSADVPATAATSEPLVILATVNVDARGNGVVTTKFDGDVDVLAGLAVAVYPVKRGDLSRLAPGGAVSTRNLRAAVAAGLVGYAAGTPGAPTADAPDTGGLDADELRDVRNDGVIDRGIDASGRVEPIPPRTGLPLERE